MSYPDVKTELDIRFGLIRKLADLSFDLQAIERLAEYYDLGIDNDIHDAHFYIDCAAMKIQDMIDAEPKRGLEAAYGEDEPDYSDVEFIEKNPKYQHRHVHSSTLAYETARSHSCCKVKEEIKDG